MGYKAFALSGRRGGVAIAPGCCPGLGASALSGRRGKRGNGIAGLLSGLEMRQNRCKKIICMKIALNSLKKYTEMMGDYKIIVTFAIE